MKPVFQVSPSLSSGHFFPIIGALHLWMAKPISRSNLKPMLWTLGEIQCIIFSRHILTSLLNKATSMTYGGNAEAFQSPPDISTIDIFLLNYLKAGSSHSLKRRRPMSISQIIALISHKELGLKSEFMTSEPRSCFSKILQTTFSLISSICLAYL